MPTPSFAFVCSLINTLNSKIVLSCRCHRCILAARSDYFRAFLERSPTCASAHTSSTSSSRQSAPSNPTAHAALHPQTGTHVSPSTGAEQTDSQRLTTSADSQHDGSSQPGSPQHGTRQDLEQSAGTSRAAGGQTGAASDTMDSTDRQLPQLAVSDVLPEVFDLVLEFAYSGSLAVLALRWLKASGAELLFEAAERYLMPLLKVLVMTS